MKSPNMTGTSDRPDGVSEWYRLLTGRTAPPPDPVRLGNSRAAMVMSLFLNYAADSVSLSQLNDIAASCGVSPDDAYAECVAASCGVGTDSADRAFTERYLKQSIRGIAQEPFLNDPYYRTVRIPAEGVSSGRFQLRMQELAPCEAFVSDDFRLFPDGRMVPQIGYFTEVYRYPAVLEDGREWMTLLPNEIRTTEGPIRNAHGRVLTYGLGLGYFAFMAAAKENVSSVTVVEQSEELLDLFRSVLLPQFPDRGKIRLVCGDAFAFAEACGPDSPYDHVFADIWHDAGDGKAMYLRFKELEGRVPSATFDYWLEKTIRCYLATELWYPGSARKTQ